MRALSALLRALLVTAVVALGYGPATAPAASACGLESARPGPQDAVLRSFARELGLSEVEAFVAVANELHRSGKLPACYLTKRAAEAKGWRPGQDLWRTAPGAALGGERFANREHRLPPAYDGRYREADLDYRGGRRGAERLIYLEAGRGTWLQWVTVDHYRRFFKLPEAE